MSDKIAESVARLRALIEEVAALTKNLSPEASQQTAQALAAVDELGAALLKSDHKFEAYSAAHLIDYCRHCAKHHDNHGVPA